MKVALVTPWDNAWVPMYKQAFEARGCEFDLCQTAEEALSHDVVVHGWTGQGEPVLGARNVMFLRRYELFSGGLAKVDWKLVDDLICVNSWIKTHVDAFFARHNIKTKTHMIYNSVDLSKWTYRDRKPNHRIGMACHVHPKKNLPLALQILALLPSEYELHIAGEVQDPCTAEYLNHLAKAMRRRVYLYGHIPRYQLNDWWEPMGFCLSTSISEGNPNNVIEAMAKGIKPIVHEWPGAEHQFLCTLCFELADTAALRIMHGSYDSKFYRRAVETDYSLANIERVVDICLQTSIKSEEKQCVY